MTECKRILCLNDLSCVGRCSLTVVLQVLGAAGLQAVPLPTAVLSTHTGGLGAPAVMNSLEFARQSLEHWQALGLEFDGIYTGYLGGEPQAALAERAFSLWPKAFKVVDPVMGDNGKLYSGVTPGLCQRLRALCRQADLILPNQTEGALLLGRPPETVAQNEKAAQALAAELTELCANVVVTGIPLGRAIACAGAGRERFLIQKLREQRSFPGTGDLFGAVVVACLAQGNALSAAVDAAAEFVAEAIRATPPQADTRFGVCYEPLLRRLISRFGY